MDSLNTATNTFTTTEAPAGHDQAMLDAVANKEAELAGIGQDAPKDEGQKILGKFSSQEELEKAYAELERKLGQRQETQQQQQQEPMDEAKANELVEKAGLDIDAMTEHFNQNGELADAHYESLEKAGIPRAFVDQYISGVRAEAEQARDQIFQEVGGQEAFEAMADWAVANLSQEELLQYNTAVESGDMTIVRSAVMSLAFRYQREVGRDPKLVGGKGGGLSGFESVAQLTAAMKDPRYNSDPAYRREVEQRLARSNIF